MKTNNFAYKLPKLKPNEFPCIKKSKKSQINFKIVNRYAKRPEIIVEGNKEGLFYIAKHLIALALHTKADEGLHIHLDYQLFNLDKNSLPIAIYKI
jgi:hypothetical protein